ncbi:MAG: hypothetical protein U0800_14685 [Isosphaeraceae bacterium]
MSELHLPPDLEDSLRGGIPPELDAGGYGVMSLFPLAELRLATLEVRSSGNAPFAEEDPHYCDYGYYAVPAVNLIRGCRNWPEIDLSYWFVWLPEERRYGSYDADHGDVVLFESRVTWTDICSDPPRYAMAAEVAGIDGLPMEFLRPWPRYEYVPDPDPPDPDSDA